jgi:hypothetical protein
MPLISTLIQRLSLYYLQEFSVNDQKITPVNPGAHDRIRTGDFFLTKEVLYLLSYVGNRAKTYYRDLPLTLAGRLLSGAGNGFRTRDPQLGRLMLYQLSYSRFFHPKPEKPPVNPRGEQHPVVIVFYGGGGRIRTSEGIADRFTVCSLWPLGNPSTEINNAMHLRTWLAGAKAPTRFYTYKS